MPSWITPEKRAAIDDLIEKGFKTNSIVRMLDTTKETVRGRRLKLGMPNDRPQAQPDQFTTYESIASTGYNGVNTPTVKPRVRVRASSVPLGTNTAYDPGSDGGIVPSGTVVRVVVVLTLTRTRTSKTIGLRTLGNSSLTTRRIISSILETGQIGNSRRGSRIGPASTAGSAVPLKTNSMTSSRSSSVFPLPLLICLSLLSL
jgi:hypothetical protein